MFRYNQNNLTRIYTKGTRIRSTNYRPNTPWAMGCQIVAYVCFSKFIVVKILILLKNFQTAGIARYIHEGMFADNGGCGYVDYIMCIFFFFGN